MPSFPLILLSPHLNSSPLLILFYMIGMNLLAIAVSFVQCIRITNMRMQALLTVALAIPSMFSGRPKGGFTSHLFNNVISMM